MNKELDMAKSAYFSINFGLSGCYMPDYAGGSQKFTSQEELANSIREELANFNLPKTLFSEAHIRRIWRTVQLRGSSRAHFDIYYEANVLSYRGLTKIEYQATQKEGE